LKEIVPEMGTPYNALKTNIGFMLNKPIGFSRDFSLAYDEIRISSDLEVRNLKSDYRLSRTQEGLLFQGTVSGEIDTQCARCLEPASVQVKAEIDEIYFFPDRVHDESEQVIPEDGYIDLGNVFRDYLLLEMPINSLCKPDCKGICTECGQNLNLAECEHTNGRIIFDA